MSTSSSNELSDVPSPPTGDKLKKTYFIARKFLKRKPTPAPKRTCLPVSSDDSESDTREGESKKAKDQAGNALNEKVEDITPVRTGLDAGQSSQDGAPITETPKSTRTYLRPRNLLSEMTGSSRVTRRTKKNFQYKLYLCKQDRKENVCKMQAAPNHSDSDSG